MNNSRKLGVKNGQLAPTPKSPNAVSSQTKDPDKHVDAFPMTGSKSQTKEKIVKSLAHLGGNSIEKESDDYVYSVFTSRLMRFKDDVELYIDESNKLVHFRSASRLGYSDLGANKKRYQAFKNLYLK